MYIIDTHCDALYKLWRDPTLNYKNADTLQTNLHRLKQGKVKVQCFAVFVPPEVKTEHKFDAALEQIELFFEKVIEPNDEMVHITSWKQINELKQEEIGAILTLEGADVFGNDLRKLKLLYRLGVRAVGLTWNHANLCADGVGEKRGAGLTELGKQVVQLNNKFRVFTDVSHISEQGFWDVMEVARYPIASHSNAKAICNHERNLTDDQVTALIQNNGCIGVVFYPEFLTGNETATIDDIIKQIDHYCSLGAARHIVFGSDFDGIDTFVTGLSDASDYQHLIDRLLKYYNEDIVRGFAYRNLLNHLPA